MGRFLQQPPSRSSEVDMKSLAFVWLAVALTAHVRAQTQEPAAPPVTTAPAPPQVSPKQHLQDAEGALAAVPENAASRSGTQKNLAQLKKDFADLAKAYTADADRVAQWQPLVYAVERDVVLLIGGGGPKSEPDDRKVAGLQTEVADDAAREA